MGWLVWPDLTDERNICQAPCNHTDCAALRAQDKTCRKCHQELQAGDKFYYEGHGPGAKVVHALCAWEEEEAKGNVRPLPPGAGRVQSGRAGAEGGPMSELTASQQRILDRLRGDRWVRLDTRGFSRNLNRLVEMGLVERRVAQRHWEFRLKGEALDQD